MIFLITLISVYALYKIEINHKVAIKDKLNSKDFEYLYDFYITRTPIIDNRPFFGNKNADINLIGYLEFNSEESKYFILEVFPKIEKDYIKNGKMRFFHKNYVTKNDFKEQNENFFYAVSLNCVEEIKSEIFWDFYFDLFNIDLKEIKILLKKYNISEKKFSDCLKNPNLDVIKEDSSEVENFDIVGMNPKFYIGIGRDNSDIYGVPSYERFKRVIRQYQLIMGD
jgi:protein-disulfide isomerase